MSYETRLSLSEEMVFLRRSTLRRSATTAVLLALHLLTTASVASSPSSLPEQLRRRCSAPVEKKSTLRRSGIPLPEGFYGNAFAYSVATATAAELCGGDLGFALELVKKAKSAVTYDYLLSVADLMVLTGRLLFALSRTYIVSDVSHAGFKSVDFGWGEAVYGGPAKGARHCSWR